MFMAEIGVMRRLSHPYIIRYLGCGVIKESQPDGMPPKHFIAVVRVGTLTPTVTRIRGERPTTPPGVAPRSGSVCTACVHPANPVYMGVCAGRFPGRGACM